MNADEKKAYGKLLNENAALTGQLEELREAALRVTWFDWSGNDPDAVAVMDKLQMVVHPLPRIDWPNMELKEL